LFRVRVHYVLSEVWCFNSLERVDGIGGIVMSPENLSFFSVFL
jgi:hypothetical protein